jgi:hypothetical protein
MPSPGKFARAMLTASMAVIFVAMPFRVTLKGWSAELSLQSASAKDGNGKGGGNGGGGKGNGGSNGKGGGNGKNASARPDENNPTGRHVNPSTGDQIQVRGTSIDVLHRNGMREGVRAGRYLMKDGKGRTIIERRATGADVARLRGMIG